MLECGVVRIRFTMQPRGHRCYNYYGYCCYRCYSHSMLAQRRFCRNYSYSMLKFVYKTHCFRCKSVRDRTGLASQDAKLSEPGSALLCSLQIIFVATSRSVDFLHEVFQGAKIRCLQLPTKLHNFGPPLTSIPKWHQQDDRWRDSKWRQQNNHWQ